MHRQLSIISTFFFVKSVLITALVVNLLLRDVSDPEGDLNNLTHIHARSLVPGLWVIEFCLTVEFKPDEGL